MYALLELLDDEVEGVCPVPPMVVRTAILFLSQSLPKTYTYELLHTVFSPEGKIGVKLDILLTRIFFLLCG